MCGRREREWNEGRRQADWMTFVISVAHPHRERDERDESERREKDERERRVSYLSSIN